MQMIDVLTKLREIADRSPEEIGRAITAAEKMSGFAPVSEASEAQKAAREKFKNMISGKKDDDKDDDKKSDSEGKKPDFLDVDKDGDKKEPMTKALKDKEDKKVDEDVQITLSGSDAVLAEILKLAGQIGAKTTKGPDAASSPMGGPTPAPALPAPTGMPATGPIPSLSSMMGDKPDLPDMGGPDMGPPGLGDEPMMDSAFSASTTPNPTTMGMGAAVPSGNDVAKPKITTPMTSPGTNPMHTAISFD